jgi:hypothetical protein
MMLLDWTRREIRENKRGAIPDNLAPILDRLGLVRSHWVKTVREFAGAGRATLLATVVSGKGGRSNRFSPGQRVDAARRPS